MADAVTSQTLVDSSARAIVKFTNISDGTGESAVVKLDPANFSCNDFYIDKIHFCTDGMSVDILWDQTTDALAISIPAGQANSFDFSYFGGLKNPAGSGTTGKINFTTVGHSAGDRYTVILEVRKVKT